jgi:hypothetical protein
MLRLRQGVQQLDPAWGLQALKGWQPDSPAHHCSWLRVTCNSQGNVTAL